jgi:prophage antirepressor-like protein
MLINKFEHPAFGTLTTITSEKTGQVMFIASEVGKMWGHTNMTQVIKRLLNTDESLKVSKSKYPAFFKELATNKMLSAKVQHFQLVTESALYKLALASNMDKAKPFRDWVTGEVLPSIRKNGYYSFADQTESIMLHTYRVIQVNNSKAINKKYIAEKGKEATIEYHRQSCLLHTGKSPKEMRAIGKAAGLKSKHTGSAKEVLRELEPARACAMSFTDNLVLKGFDLKTVSELSLRAALPLFEGMIELGAINPKMIK